MKGGIFITGTDTGVGKTTVACAMSTFRVSAIHAKIARFFIDKLSQPKAAKRALAGRTILRTSARFE